MDNKAAGAREDSKFNALSLMLIVMRTASSSLLAVPALIMALLAMAAPVWAADDEPFMIGVYSFAPENAAEAQPGEDAYSSTLSLGVGPIFRVPAEPTAAKAGAPATDDVIGLSLTYSQDTPLGVSPYLGLGVGATAIDLSNAATSGATRAYEFSLGVKAPVAAGAQVDLGYRLQGAEKASGEPEDQRHDFMVGVRYSF